MCFCGLFFFFFSSRRRHTRLTCDWSSDVCSSDLDELERLETLLAAAEHDCSLTRGDQDRREPRRFRLRDARGYEQPSEPLAPRSEDRGGMLQEIARVSSDGHRDHCAARFEIGANENAA